MVHKAPYSFLVIFVLLLGACWTGFHFYYATMFAAATDEARHWEDTATRWRSDASYYQDIAKRTISQDQEPQKSTYHQRSSRSAPKPTKAVAPKGPAKPPEATNKAPVIAPNGVAIGGDNNGSASVTNNYGPPQRTLTAVQRSIFLSQLGPPPADGFDGVYCIMGDQEGHRYAQQFWEAFQQQGWNVGKMVGQIVLTQNVSGVFLAVSPEDASTPPDGVMKAYAALRAAGIEVQGMKMRGVEKGHWYVLVGNAPVKR